LFVNFAIREVQVEVPFILVKALNACAKVVPLKNQVLPCGVNADVLHKCLFHESPPPKMNILALTILP